MVTTLGFPVRLGLHTIVRDSPRINACRVILTNSLRLTHSVLLSSFERKFCSKNYFWPSLVKFSLHYSDTIPMQIQTLDFIFPFFVFSYGILVVLVLENKRLALLGQNRMPQLFAQLSAHKGIAWLSFWVGGLWSLQNILFS